MDSTFEHKRKLENTKCKPSNYLPLTLKGPASADVMTHGNGVCYKFLSGCIYKIHFHKSGG